ncbi:MAG TPA: FAD-binding monooxygenase, partial [Mycobacterium sp.]|nr:FAD-binding monooxygenase [Mycobacterium sp.]
HDRAAEALREVFGALLVDEQPLRRIGAPIAGDRHPLPLTRSSRARPDRNVRTRPRPAHRRRHLLRRGPAAHRAALLLDLAGRPELRELALGWRDRVDVLSAEAEHRPADALLIRPDAYVAWAASIDEPTDTAVPGLRGALSCWFGVPVEATVDQ